MNNIQWFSIVFMLSGFTIVNNVHMDNTEDKIISAVKDNGCIPHIHIPKQNPKRKQKQMKDIYNYASLWGK